MAESEADPAESVNRRVLVGCPKVQDPSHTPVEFRRLHSRSPFSAESTFIPDEELDQIVSNAEAFAKQARCLHPSFTKQGSERSLSKLMTKRLGFESGSALSYNV
jgi:hypothetical protein